MGLREVIEAMTEFDAGKVDVQHLCKLAGVSRASYCRPFAGRADTILSRLMRHSRQIAGEATVIPDRLNLRL